MEIPISASVHTLSQTWHGFENQGQGFTLGDYLIIHRHTSFYCPSFTWLHFSDTAFLKKKKQKTEGLYVSWYLSTSNYKIKMTNTQLVY